MKWTFWKLTYRKSWGSRTFADGSSVPIPEPSWKYPGYFHGITWYYHLWYYMVLLFQILRSWGYLYGLYDLYAFSMWTKKTKNMFKTLKLQDTLATPNQTQCQELFPSLHRPVVTDKVVISILCLQILGHILLLHLIICVPQDQASTLENGMWRNTTLSDAFRKAGLTQGDIIIRRNGQGSMPLSLGPNATVAAKVLPVKTSGVTGQLAHRLFVGMKRCFSRHGGQQKGQKWQYSKEAGSKIAAPIRVNRELPWRSLKDLYRLL